MLSDVLYLSKAPVLLCLENTILNWATTIPDYSESIIILAIIAQINANFTSQETLYPKS